jgi:hypothetical protein
MVMGNGDLYAHDNGFEGSIGKGENGGIHSGLDPYTESISMLQSAQEALENGIVIFPFTLFSQRINPLRISLMHE